MNLSERIEAQTIAEMNRDLDLAMGIIGNFDDPRIGGPIAYILAQAAAEATEATVALTKVSPTNAQEIMQLQGIILRQKDIAKWLSTALIAGKQAFDLLGLQDRGLLFEEITDSLRDGD